MTFYRRSILTVRFRTLKMPFGNDSLCVLCGFSRLSKYCLGVMEEHLMCSVNHLQLLRI